MMAKAKGSKSKSVPNKHIHARLSYLHQASSYLALARKGQKLGGEEDAVVSVEEDASKQDHQHAQSRHLLSQLRAVSLKSQIRLTPQIKHTVCKRCNSLLMAGKTSTKMIINESRGRRKPQADVVVVRCYFCGNVKRFPVGQPKRFKAAAVGKDNRPKDA